MTNHNETQRQERTVAFSRRRFLRGLGVTLALPVLPSLLPRLARAETVKAPVRMAFMSIPNGVQQDHWFPTDDFQLNTTMQPLESLKSHFQVISGLDHQHATAGRDGAGDHARASATFLTGARARKTAGSDIHIGVSVDQVAAQKLGHLTRFPSLELSSDMIRNSGSCDSGYACAYQYNLAWSSPSTPVTPESNPRLVFERLFGAGEPGERQQNYVIRQETERSILDFVLEETGDVQRRLGAQDRRKFDEYLTVVRDMEKRLKAAEQFNALPDTKSTTPAGVPSEFGDYMQIMYDMLVLAFQTDATRIGTLLLAYDGSNRTFPQIGVSEGHHYLTHNQRSPQLKQKVAEIDKFYITAFANFLEKMSKTEDVDGRSLLDNSMIVYGGAIADGNRHSHDNLPVILAGHGGAGSVGGHGFATGRHLKLDRQPMSNLFVSMLNRFGVETKLFGDSTARVEQV